MRQWTIDLIGSERWDQLLAVLAVVLIAIVPLTMLFYGLGLWQRLPWTGSRDEADHSGDQVRSDDAGGTSD